MININSNRYVNHAKKIWRVAFDKTFVYPFETYFHHQFFFSQEGEDCILSRVFERQCEGFYIDVGAHHPQRFSNTYLFYLRGWRGINIDAMPGSRKLFEDLRPEDINIEAAISDSSEELTYYMFNEPALNGLSERISAERNSLEGYQITCQKKIKSQKLSEILDKYLLEGQVIDFLSIDVEGADYQVLLSNDWSKYRPKVILVEELYTSLENLSEQSEIFAFLGEKGYELFAKTFNTSFYRLGAT